MRVNPFVAFLFLMPGCVTVPAEHCAAGYPPHIFVDIPPVWSWIEDRQPYDFLMDVWDAPGNTSVLTNQFTVAGPRGPTEGKLRLLGTGKGSALYSMTIEIPTGESDVHVDGLAVYDDPSGTCKNGTPFVQETHLFSNPGEFIQSGNGTHVWYAGFFPNGTLFGTNIQRIDTSPIPRVSWYQAEPYEPLPVYVYDKDRSEEPPHWKNLIGATPAAGSPADRTAGLGYYTTIKGFNDALKGLSTTGSRVVLIPPELAYPDPIDGAPGLGGSPLVFLIEPYDVVRQPCPTSLPPCPQIVG